MVSKIKALCEKNHITVHALEKQLGLSHNSIRNWDKNIPSFEKVVMVAEYFGILVDDLKKEE